MFVQNLYHAYLKAKKVEAAEIEEEFLSGSMGTLLRLLHFAEDVFTMAVTARRGRIASRVNFKCPAS